MKSKLKNKLKSNLKSKISALTIAVLLTITSGAFATNSFSDVKSGDWYYEYVMRITDMGLVSGFKDGTFRPNDEVTRGQLAKIIVEYDKKVVSAIRASSTDEQAVINSVASAVPSTVKISSDGSVGSGFFVEKNHIMTNAHVVGSKTSVTVTTTTGEKMTGTVVAIDVAKDIALVKILKDFKALQFSTSLTVGQNAISIGNPLGQENTVSKGIVSKLNVTQFKQSVMFQMDTPTNAGNSGGAVINTNGEVIGMTTGKFTARSGEASIEGIAFAIRAEDLENFMKTYIK